MAWKGLKREETMAFGDGGNDIPIIREAGIGVAMGNANESLKAVADYVTSSVEEDGISQALKHWVLDAASICNPSPQGGFSVFLRIFRRFLLTLYFQFSNYV